MCSLLPSCLWVGEREPLNRRELHNPEKSYKAIQKSPKAGVRGTAVP